MTPQTEPTIEEMRIEVCRWMGQDPFPRCNNPECEDCSGALGGHDKPLTLDWLRSCFLKLPPEQKKLWVNHIWAIIYPDQKYGPCEWEVALMSITDEQFLTALWRTIQ